MSQATVLKRLREEAGLTQAQLAARIGIPASVLSAYENGKREPRVDVFFRAVGALGLDVTYEPSSRDAGLRLVVPDAEEKAKILVHVTELAIAMPRRDRGELQYPPFRVLARIKEGAT